MNLKKMVCVTLSLVICMTIWTPAAFAAENKTHRYAGIYEKDSATVVWKGIESTASFDDTTGIMTVISTDVETGEVVSTVIYEMREDEPEPLYGQAYTSKYWRDNRFDYNNPPIHYGLACNGSSVAVTDPPNRISSQAQIFGDELREADDSMDQIFRGVVGFTKFDPLGQLIDEANGKLTSTQESQALALIEIIGGLVPGATAVGIIASCSLAASHRYSVRQSFQEVYKHVYGTEANI